MPPLRKLAPMMLLALGVAGCAAPSFPETVASSSTDDRSSVQGDMGHLTYRAVDKMLDTAVGLPPGTPLIVASLTDAQQLEQSSLFGNIVADMIRSRLAQRGMRVSEVRLRSAMRLAPGQGELMLSRETRALLSSPNVAGIVTGTYAVGGERVWVSLKLVSGLDAQVLGASDFALTRQGDVESLLRPAVLERRVSSR
jgi:TolB-like protein